VKLIAKPSALKGEEYFMSSLSELASTEVIQKIDHWISKFPENQRQSAILPAMLLLQKANQGWLSDTLIEALATYLNMESVDAFAVASFYSMLELAPVGRHKISVCTNISCMLNNCDAIVAHLEKKCRTKLGSTSADGKFTLREVECMGACIGAPMLEYNEKYYEKLTVAQVDELLDTME